MTLWNENVYWRDFFAYFITQTSRSVLAYILLLTFDLEIYLLKLYAMDCYAKPCVYMQNVNHNSINLPDDTFMSTHLLCISHCVIRLIIFFVAY